MTFNLSITDLAITDEHEQFEDTLHYEFKEIEEAFGNIYVVGNEDVEELVELRGDLKSLLIAIQNQLDLWKDSTAIEVSVDTNYINNQINYSGNWYEHIGAIEEEYILANPLCTVNLEIDSAVESGNWNNLGVFTAWYDTNHKTSHTNMWDTWYKEEEEHYIPYIIDGLYEVEANCDLEDRLIKAIKYVEDKLIEINKTLFITHPELCI